MYPVEPYGYAYRMYELCRNVFFHCQYFSRARAPRAFIAAAQTQARTRLRPFRSEGGDVIF